MINIFRKLHRVTQRVFKGDVETLTSVRSRIREEFHSNKDVTDSEDIAKLLSDAREVEKILRERVVQAVMTEDNLYSMKIREETVLEDTPPLKPMDNSKKKQ